MLLKKRLRLVDKARVEVVAQIILNVTRHADEDAPLQKQKQATHRAGSDDFERRDRQLRPGYLLPIRVDGTANDQWNRDVKDNARHDAGDAHNQRHLVRLKEFGQFPQIVHERPQSVSALRSTNAKTLRDSSLAGNA